MKKSFLRILALAMAMLMVMSVMSFASADAEPRTIRILHKGPKPDGWDAVYAKYLELTKDTINVELDIDWVEHADYKQKLNLEITSGGDWDLVFDAAWIHLKTLAAEGYYADLSQYFNNPEEYPGLAAGFTADTMKANTWFGKMCYIPLFETYGNGLPVIWYRQDWANEWGVGKIDSYEKLEQYWQAAIDNGYIGYACTSARGFFQLMTLRGEGYPGSAQAGLQMWSAGGLSVWFYIQDGKIVSYAVEGAGDEAFKDFPEGWNYDFAAKRYDTFGKWQQAGYIDPDSMSVTDAAASFNAGLSASYIGTLDDVEGVKAAAAEYAIGWENIGYFIYVDEVAKMQNNVIPTNRAGNNGWAVPATSKNVEATMDFLDWMFGSQANHDLIQLGLEGVDFEYGENGTYKPLTDYSAKLGGYGFSWNPAYALISQAYEGDLLKYRQWEYSEDAFVSYPVLGFNFNTSDLDLSTAIAQCKAVTDLTAIVKLHGIAMDGNGVAYDSVTEMLKANTEAAMANGGQQIVDAMVEQLTAHLEAQAK